MTTKILAVPHITQHQSPFCLYASTAMVLNYFGIEKTLAEVAQEVIFSAPGSSEAIGETAAAIKDYLSDYGLEADFHREQDWSDITGYIDKGFPLITLVKSSSSSTQVDHAWVIRGYDDEKENDVIFNNPQKDPGVADPITYDPDHDDLPGETIEYHKFVEEHWTGPFPIENKAFIAVSYKGQGASEGNFLDWRGAGTQNSGDFFYHLVRFGKKLVGLEIFEAVIELVLTVIGFVGMIVGGLQIIGQLIEKGGEWLINTGKKLWDSGEPAKMALGALLIVVGAVIYVVGFVIDFITGVVGVVINAISSVIDAIGSIFTGSNGNSDSETLGESTVELGMLLNVDPWKSRWGDNWEKISGNWAVATADAQSVDELDIRWKVWVWGWGVDSFSLSREVMEHNGTLVREALETSTKYKKEFRTELTNVQGIRMRFGKNKCVYGGWGGLTRVKLEVHVIAKRGASMVSFKESTAVWGLST